MTEKTYDLMYIGDMHMYDECKRELLRMFPNAVISDASDDVHRYRFEVECESVTRDEWLLWLFRSGWFQSSIMYHFDSMSNTDSLKSLMRQVIDERKRCNHDDDN